MKSELLLHQYAPASLSDSGRVSLSSEKYTNVMKMIKYLRLVLIATNLSLSYKERFERHDFFFKGSYLNPYLALK